MTTTEIQNFEGRCISTKPHEWAKIRSDPEIF